METTLEKVTEQRNELLNALQLLMQEYAEYQRVTGNRYGLQNTNAEKVAIQAIKKATE